MKESNFYSDDFEQLIRGKTEQYKMYPSENVWKGVHSALHTKRKWFIGSMAVLVTGILFLAGRELIAPTHTTALHKPAAGAGSVASVARTSTPAEAAHVPLAAIRPANSSSDVARHSALSGGLSAGEADPAYAGITITVSHPVLSQADLSEWLSHVVRLPEQAPAIAVIETKPATAEGVKEEPVARTPETTTGHKETENTLADADAHNVVDELSAGRSNRSRHGQREQTASNRTPVNGGNLSGSTANDTRADAPAIAEADDRSRVNWLHDYAMNLLPPSSKRPRTYFQLTLAPTVNYSKLGGVDQAEQKFGTSYTGNALRHSAALGFEFGGSILYRVTRNLSVKGGLQFNFSRYHLDTYATLDPSNPTGITYFTSWGYAMDTVMANRNNQGRSALLPSKTVQTLDNDYYQLSAPIGLELRVLGNERLQFNVGATIQPSYLFNTNSYIMSQNFSEYDKRPALYRRWNLNGGIEAFLSYRTGAIRWQIGPEFRYQLFSSYGSQYPISENLKGYGIKIGITKMLP
jgi:outer membrane protein with beta-barrel domain